MRHLTALGSALCVVMASSAPVSAYDICVDAVDCEKRAEADIAAGRNEQALEALVAEADLATGAGDEEHLFSALQSLTAVNIKLGNPLMAHAWAQAALVAFDQDPRALANLETAKQALQGQPAPSAISGTYDSYAGYGYWSELKIDGQDTGKIQTQWLMLRFGTVASAWDDGPAAMWELWAEGQYADGNLAITYQGMDGAACHLNFKRTELAIELVSPQPDELPPNCQTGGAGVYPIGPFWLVDTAVPTLEEQSAPDEGTESGEDEEESGD